MPSIFVKANLPTASATRYDGSGFVSANATSFQRSCPTGVPSGVLETTS